MTCYDPGTRKARALPMLDRPIQQLIPKADDLLAMNPQQLSLYAESHFLGAFRSLFQLSRRP